MKRLPPTFSTLCLPVLAGLLMSWNINRLPSVTTWEERALPYPERFSPETHLAHFGEPGSFTIKVFDTSSKATPSSTPPAYLVDSNTVDILGQSPLGPANWAFLINSINEAGSKHLTISQTLSWEKADELTLRALEHELSRLESYTVGIELLRGAIPEAFPAYLEGSVIPSPDHAEDDIPEVNKISPHPSIESPRYGFTQLERVQKNSTRDSIELPLLARWGEHLLPSLELASLMSTLGIPAKELSYRPGISIQLGSSGLIIPIDKAGRTRIPLKKTKLLSAAKILENPENAPDLVALNSPEAPLHLQQLPFTLQYLESRKSDAPIVYTRLPLWKEAAFLIFFVLVLHFRRWWLTIIVALAYLAFPLVSHEWLLFSPAASATIVFLILSALRIRKLRSAPSALNSTIPSGSPGRPLQQSPAKESLTPDPPTPEESRPSKLPQRRFSLKRSPKTSAERIARKRGPD